MLTTTNYYRYHPHECRQSKAVDLVWFLTSSNTRILYFVVFWVDKSILGSGTFLSRVKERTFKFDVPRDQPQGLLDTGRRTLGTCCSSIFDEIKTLKSFFHLFLVAVNINASFINTDFEDVFWDSISK